MGGDGDGGVDGFYVFANRKLIREGMDASIFRGQRLNIELVVLQAKNKPSFEESVPMKLKDFVENCLQLGADTNAADTLYSERLRDAVKAFHDIYREGLTMQPSLTITFFHAAHADHVDAKVRSRGDLLRSRTREFFPVARVDSETVTGSELIKLHHQRPESTLYLKAAKTSTGTALSGQHMFAFPLLRISMPSSQTGPICARGCLRPTSVTTLQTSR